jgi:hypothetical protein
LREKLLNRIKKDGLLASGLLKGRSDYIDLNPDLVNANKLHTILYYILCLHK